MVDPYDIPKAAVPEWMTYRWVRKSTMGQKDTENLKRAESEGWRAVPRVRHRNLPAAKLWNVDSEPAEYGGLILMERPDHMTIATQAELRKKAFEMSGHIIGPRVEPNETPYVAPHETPKRNVFRRLVDALVNK